MQSADRTRLVANLKALMLEPGLSGHEGRVRRLLASRLHMIGLKTHTDNPGNLIATLPGKPHAPSVMLYTHMDQLGFVVRKIEKDGYIRVERLGGVPERALASQEVLLCVGDNQDVTGVLANKSHHATTADEKYRVVPIAEMYIDTGLSSRDAVIAAGIDIGTPVVYAPRFIQLAQGRICGTSIDDRAGCAVLLEVARQLVSLGGPGGEQTATDRVHEALPVVHPTVHLVFSVQEEYNLRGAMIAAQALQPDIAIQLDLMQSCDTPDMEQRGDAVLGGGPAISLYSFHGRGTLNGTIAHPALVHLFECTARQRGSRLQKSAQSGVLTDNAYVQLTGKGVAAIDVGFPLRYSHSSRELCDAGDLVELADLLCAALAGIDESFSLNRDDYIA